MSKEEELNEEQITWLDECTSGTWSLNPETGLVDVNGNFDCRSQKLKDFKGVRFGVITGCFWCYRNSLTTLEGAPQEVGSEFSCSNNKLTSLEGVPQQVRGNFHCHNNKLTSLEGGPQEVSGDFSCAHNKLTSLEGGPKKVGGYFNCSSNSLTSFKGGPQEHGYRRRNPHFDCSNNPISDGLNREQLNWLSGGTYPHQVRFPKTQP